MGFEFKPVRYNEQKLYVSKEVDTAFVEVYSSDFKFPEQPVLLGDFNGDGNTDKVTVEGYTTLATVNIYQGYGYFPTGQWNISGDFSKIFDPKKRIDHLEVRDVDNDGDLDILCRVEESRNAVYRSSSDRTPAGFNIVYGYYLLVNQQIKS